jgi:peptidyl-prolyl cis-trans isomerase A (cyclophilin A)
MLARFALTALLCLAAAPALAQEAPASAPQPETVRVTIETSEGAIGLALEKERAPITTANFLRYVDLKRLDGTTFYRAAKVADGYGLIQGGTKGDPKRTFAPIKHEPTTLTGLSNTDGAIAMARHAPGTAAGDFFLIVGDMASLDANPSQPGDNAGFAAFGHVVAGMDVVRKILESPTSPTEGEGVMKGQMLAPPIRIITARRGE